MKLYCTYCTYDHSNPKKVIATRQCDICGKLLCDICGYTDKGLDYCNSCWREKEEDEKFDYHPRPEEENLSKKQKEDLI